MNTSQINKTSLTKNQSQTEKHYHNIFREFQSKFFLDVTHISSASASSTQSMVGFVHEKLLSLDLPEKINQRIVNEFFKMGPIEDLIDLDDLNEIIINGGDSIWVERKGVVYQHKDHFFSQLSYSNFIVRLCEESKLQLTLNRAFANGKWKQFRVHIVDSSLTDKAPLVTLRKHELSTWTLPRLQDNQWAPAKQMESLKKIIKSRQNLMIVGPTSSGKTSILNACLQECNPNDRIVCIEDTDEISLPNLCSAKLLTRSDPLEEVRAYDQSELVKQSLRMRPDRIVMGEVRGTEAKDLLMALSTGHRGSIGTLHANSAKEALIRLEMLIQWGAPNWQINAIRRLILYSVDYIIVAKKEGSKRFLEGIYRLTSLEDFGILLERHVPNL